PDKARAGYVTLVAGGGDLPTRDQIALGINQVHAPTIADDQRLPIGQASTGQGIVDSLILPENLAMQVSLRDTDDWSILNPRVRMSLDRSALILGEQETIIRKKRKAGELGGDAAQFPARFPVMAAQ